MRFPWLLPPGRVFPVSAKVTLLADRVAVPESMPLSDELDEIDLSGLE